MWTDIYVRVQLHYAAIMLNSSVASAEKQHAGRKQCNGLPNMAVHVLMNYVKNSLTECIIFCQICKVYRFSMSICCLYLSVNLITTKSIQKNNRKALKASKAFEYVTNLYWINVILEWMAWTDVSLEKAPQQLVNDRLCILLWSCL